LDYLISISLIIIPIIVGLIPRLVEKKRCDAKLLFASSYLIQFQKYIENFASNTEAYVYMIKNSNRMQNQLGNQGLLTIKKPFNGVIIRNYTIILSGLTELESYLSQPILKNQTSQLAKLIIDALLRNIGDNENRIKEIISSLKNPVILYKEGWYRVISLPLLILEWLGLVTRSTLVIIIHNVIFKIIIGIISLIGLISSIMTITLGYKEFLKLIIELLN
jgi:hypothetical protein